MPKTPPSKLAFSRIVEIDRRLRSRCLPTLDELSREFGVSRRTIERDIESMRDYFGAPIEYDRNKRTYKYTETSFGLPATTLTQQELHSLLVAERALRQYSGTPFEESPQNSLVHRTINKLISLLPGNKQLSENLKDLCKAVVFETGSPFTEYSPQIFSSLLEAIEKERTIQMTYYSMSTGQEGVRKVDPLHVANWGGDWYLIGRCRTHNDIRNFHLTRIREVIVTDEDFTRPDNFDPKQYMEAGFGQMIGGKIEKVKIRFLPPSSRWIKEKIWHPTQILAEHKDGSIEMTMEVSALEAVKRFVLQFGSQTELLEPKDLRKEIGAELEKAGRKYRK